MNVLRRFQSRTFSALAIPNYRRYYGGQAISLVGTWMQTIAQGWLLLTLTGSGTALGLLVAVQMTPILLLGPYGGVIADRVDKRRLMMLVQACMGSLALVLGMLSGDRPGPGLARLRARRHCSAAAPSSTTRPARRSCSRWSGRSDLRNAVSLNSVLVNAARAVGPAVAGILIATVGVSVCFLVNAVSYIAVIVSLATLDRARAAADRADAAQAGPAARGTALRALDAGLAIPLCMMALIGTLAYEFQVVLPVVARETFHGGPEVYGFMTAAMGIGAVVGRPRRRRLGPHRAARDHHRGGGVRLRHPARRVGARRCRWSWSR